MPAIRFKARGGPSNLGWAEVAVLAVDEAMAFDLEALGEPVVGDCQPTPGRYSSLHDALSSGQRIVKQKVKMVAP